jgi:hypothetical protein
MEITDKENFTRKQLYDLVWSQSLLSLSKKYRISDVGLRKICSRMSIPLPRAGHWEKLKHGKPVTVIPLPITNSGEKEVTLYIRDQSDNADNAIEKLSVNKVAKEIRSNTDLQLEVPERLKRPGKLIASAKDSLSRKEAKSSLYRGVVTTESGELDIRVAPQNVSRALRIMDTLIKALRSRKHDIEIVQDRTNVIIEAEKIQVSLKEKLKKVAIEKPKYSWQNIEYHPTGILSFRIEGQRQWEDGKQSLEEQLNKILAWLEAEVARRKQRQEESERIREQNRERKRLRKELEERKQKELAGFKKTLQKATRWHKATNLRNYIDAVEQIALASHGVTKELQAWLEWARKKADWYDPFTECDDELLNDVDKESLTFKNKSLYYP